MRNDERLRTIYEVMAPYIVRNEHNWRDYLAFASQFHKHSFDNILLVYAQDEDVSILATRKQWAAIGRNLIPRAKGVAVCVYRNAKLTLDYLFDVSQTTGKEIHPTDWQLSDEMKKALTERLSYAHGFPKQDFPQALYAMASESVAENYNHFLQELKQETKGHLFTEIPAGGFEAQYIQLLTDSISYFIGKKCHLPDEEIQLSDGMATVSHFNTLPLVAHLGTAVTALSKGILLEVERNIKIINRERMAQHEQTEYQSEIQGAGRDDASRSANLQQQRSRSTSGQVRPDGPGIPQRESPGAIYDFENGWQSDGDHAPGTGRGDREDRSPDAANAPAGAASADRGHHGADATPEQSETDGGGNRTPERSPDSPLTEEQPNTEVAPSAAPVGEPSEKDGSFSVPAEQPTRHFTDAEVRRNYEYILTSTNLYPSELHSAVRSVLSEPPLNPDWSDKGRQIAALFTPYGDREYQGDLLYRTRLHGEDGISFFFDEGYTYIPWNGLAFLLDAMIEDGDYPNPVVAFVHDATSEAQRQELFERTRQGKVRILIGSTSKLGTGVNVQNKVISIDHLDCPWKPSDITQRNGRGVRQGNENPEIMIKQFVAKGTFDAYLWQIQEQKLRYITQILTGKHIARSCEDVDETVLSAAQFKAAATDNPMVAQKMELENRVTELKILRGAWSNEQLALEHKVNLTYPSRIREYEQKIERVTQDISLLGQTEGKDFSIVLDGKHYTERPAAGEAFALLYRMISEGHGKDEYEFEIGSYRGFSLFVNFNPFERDIILLPGVWLWNLLAAVGAAHQRNNGAVPVCQKHLQHL